MIRWYHDTNFSEEVVQQHQLTYTREERQQFLRQPVDVRRVEWVPIPLSL